MYWFWMARSRRQACFAANLGERSSLEQIPAFNLVNPTFAEESDDDGTDAPRTTKKAENGKQSKKRKRDENSDDDSSDSDRGRKGHDDESTYERRRRKQSRKSRRTVSDERSPSDEDGDGDDDDSDRLDERASMLTNSSGITKGVVYHAVHEERLRGLGLGSVRLLVAGLQRHVAGEAPMILIDELEHGFREWVAEYERCVFIPNHT